MLNDIILFAINGGGWALKPILEKISVDKMGYFISLSFVILLVESLPSMFYQYHV